jgi:hypothetical protein
MEGSKDDHNPFKGEIEVVEQKSQEQRRVLAESNANLEIAQNVGNTAVKRSWRESRLMRYLTPAIVAGGLGSGLALEVSDSSAQTVDGTPNVPTHVQPITPRTIEKLAETYYLSNIQTEDFSKFNLTKFNLADHKFLREGTCNPMNPNNPNVKLSSWSLKGVNAIDCVKVNGKYYSHFMPRKDIDFTPAAQKIYFTPAVVEIGDDAAKSIGLVSEQYGNPTDVSMTLDTNKSGKITASYSKNVNDPYKQIKDIKFTVKNGKETYKPYWYQGGEKYSPKTSSSSTTTPTTTATPTTSTTETVPTTTTETTTTAEPVIPTVTTDTTN